MQSDAPWVVASPKRNLRTAAVEVWTARPVLFALVKREIYSRYRASFFGFAWAIAKPLAQLLIFALVIGKFLGASRAIENYALFIFVGLMFWGFISESVVIGTSSITSNAGLVTKISFPREILPLSGVLIAGFNFLVQIPVLVLGYIFIGKFPAAEGLLALPALLASTIFLALALALAFSAVNVFARDAQHLVELLVMLMMYLAPIIYSWVFVRDIVMTTFGNDLWFKVYMSNPFAALVTGFQDSLWPGTRYLSDGKVAPDLVGVDTLTLWVLPVISFFFLLFCYRTFLKHERNFAREL